MRYHWFLYPVFLTLIVLFNVFPAFMQEQEPVCEGTQEGACLNLPSLPQSLQIDSNALRGLTGLPIFANPMISFSLVIREGTPLNSDGTVRVYIPNRVYEIVDNLAFDDNGNGVPVCDLIIAGFADDQQQPVQWLDLTPGSHNPRLFAFCQRNNLPIPGSGGLPNSGPPSGLFRSGDWQPVTVNKLADQFAGIIDRAREGTCQTEPDANNGLRLHNMATQIAVFIAYDRVIAQADWDRIWETYHQQARSSVYQNHYAAIHCLLGEAAPPLVTAMREQVRAQRNDHDEYIVPAELIFTNESSGHIEKQEFHVIALSGETGVTDGVESPSAICTAIGEGIITLPRCEIVQPGRYRVELNTTGVDFTNLDGGAQPVAHSQDSTTAAFELDFAPDLINENLPSLEPSPSPTLWIDTRLDPPLEHLTIQQSALLFVGLLVGVVVIVAAIPAAKAYRRLLLIVLIVLGLLIIALLARPFASSTSIDGNPSSDFEADYQASEEAP